MPLTFDSAGTDGAALFWSVTRSQRLFCIPTQHQKLGVEGAQCAVRSRGEKGVSDGIDADGNGRVYMGDFEQDAVRRG